jgi:GNAT superfamily N-acetyltransferase
MPQPVSSTIKGPDGPLNIILGEATPAQRAVCWNLSGTVFAPQLPSSVFPEHGEIMFNHELVRDNGERYWCVSLADEPLTVIAMCGTMRRTFLIRDGESTREEIGYCVFAVATHPQYRRLGLAKMVMNYVAEWLDGEAETPVSILYTSVGDVSEATGRRAK